MDDDEIVELFLKKDESAIIHTAEKYGCRLRSISQRITADILTAEECENDTCSKPDELTYKDAAIITHMLRDIIPISNIFVKSLHSDQNIKQIQITDFQVGMDGICKLLYYNKGIKIKEYLLNISKMNYSNYSSVISLELNDISLVDEGYIAYSAAGHGFGNEYPRVYFSSGEKIIIKRKENL